MENVEEGKLYTDLLYRYQYMCKFMDFDENDVKLIHGNVRNNLILAVHIIEAKWKNGLQYSP